MTGDIEDRIYIPDSELGLRRLDVGVSSKGKFLIEWSNINGVRTPVFGYRVLEEDSKGYHCVEIDDVVLARLNGNRYFAPTRGKNRNKKKKRLFL